jgi:hypothetical protein
VSAAADWGGSAAPDGRALEQWLDGEHVRLVNTEKSVII